MSRLAEALRSAEQGTTPSDVGEESGSDALSASAVPDALAAPDYGLPYPGTVLPFNRLGASALSKLIVKPNASPQAVEQYRRLAASLHHVQAERNLKVLMITSATPGDGKTLTSTNLALTLSESYRRRVLLIDADLRRPTLHQVFELPNVLGLSDALKSEIDQKLSVIQVSPNLTILPAGRPDPDPMGGLTSDRMRRIVHESAARFDWVIIDTPPAGFLSDAKLLVEMVDAAVFVVRAGKSPYRLVQRALDAIGRDNVLGVVLNGVEASVDAMGYEYYGYYGLRQDT